MLTPLINRARDYAWGSKTLIADLQRRDPSGAPEAEVWFGDHPGSPATLPDGTGLDEWLRREGDAAGVHPPLPYLLKLLAAASPLSIQVHPSKTQAEAGFARDEAAGTPVDAPERNYRDDNHKPEVIVALGERFEALAGLRDLGATRRMLDALPAGPGIAALRAHLEGSDPAAALRRTLEWLLSGTAQDAVDDVIAGLAEARSGEFAETLAAARRIAAAYPGDPGVVVALLMNHVVLRRGEALFVPAGILHAYLDGLGVEIMAASDNVLRGGLTPKHIDVAELLRIVDARPTAPPVLAPVPIGDGVEVLRPGVADFELWHVRPDGAGRTIALPGPAIVVVTEGTVGIAGGSGATVELSAGSAAFATPDEGHLRLTGSGEAYVAVPGAR